MPFIIPGKQFSKCSAKKLKKNLAPSPTPSSTFSTFFYQAFKAQSNTRQKRLDNLPSPTPTTSTFPIFFTPPQIQPPLPQRPANLPTPNLPASFFQKLFFQKKKAEKKALPRTHSRQGHQLLNTNKHQPTTKQNSKSHSNLFS